MDAKKERPSISEIMDDYWELMPRYQGVAIDEVEFKRILYGCFPTYRDSPLQSPFNCIVPVGDASGIQSPLSFGGFGSLTRHLERVVTGLGEALDSDLVDAKHICMLNPYQPNLSCCWMFQRSMSVPVDRKPVPGMVIGTLSNSFSAMESLGEATMLPFLQDVLMFGPLLRTLVKAGGQDLLTPFKILPHVGIIPFCDFLYHFTILALYTLLSKNLSGLLLSIADNNNLSSPSMRYSIRRKVDAWKFGAGLDYYDHE